ncbi:HAMP domain-containing histidine kinase, partial [Pseudanabaenaceae cyanobacterium LEGE 13415]|nr:HAMP domain-containing histidine kinase [Pseudanabaenaceae cyanobacterium LEGE 13415]
AQILEKVHQEEWLTEFPVAFTINPMRLDDSLETVLYFCPYSYYQQQCHYLLVIGERVLSPIAQQLIQKTALMLNEYLEHCLEQSQQRQKLQFLEQILQRVGHQLRQPLSLISLYAENIHHKVTEKPLREQATIIQETIQDLDRQLTELMVCSSGSLRLSEQDLCELLIESKERFQPWIDEKRLQIIYPKTSVRMMVDRLQIKQVFDNLINNAIHFSPINGTIRFNLQVFRHEVVMTIADQGTGLSSEDLQRLFVPFYSRRPGGTGLGLAIAQKVVQDHRGNLWARNLAKGAEFSLILPRSVSVMS